MTQIDIEKIITTAIEAGNKIMEVYEKPDFETEMKEGNFPLTLADKLSHEIIQSALTELYPDIPILSEEGKDISYEERKNWKRFWLVDPLDGTKEFIKRNGEFTVNIALIENNIPVIGVIYAPVLKLLYYASEGNGAFMSGIENGIVKNKIKLERGKKREDGKVIAVGSRSHSSPEEEAILQKFGVTEKISIGSSLKFCMVAEGKADIYYRHGPTMEWDVAAGDIIIQSAGCKGNKIYGELKYNKENLLNGSFMFSFF
jgi:3'(2'), 5'-bisphosphate nucleotidase